MQWSRVLPLAHGEEDKVYDATVVSQVENGEREKLANCLSKGKDPDSGVGQQILECALDFQDVFALDDREQGEAKGVKHVIDTGDSQPMRQLPWRVPFALCKEISRMLQEMLDGDIVQESDSPWASPVGLIKKTEHCASALITKDSMP